MARRKSRPSQRQSVLQSRNGRALYFYVRNGAIFLIPFLICQSIYKTYPTLAYILFLPLVYIMYRWVAHYVAMFVTLLESFLGGGKF